MAIDEFKKGEKYYRHFIVVYEDQKGIEYVSKAIWELSQYIEKEPLKFDLVERRTILRKDYEKEDS